MRALVTGAGGFIGRHVVGELVDAGAEVVAFDLAFAGEPGSRGAELITGDVLDADSVREAVRGCDAVFNLAAVYSYSRADAPLMEAVNVLGTRTVLEAAARAGVRRVIHTSSCTTCGPVRGRAATERDFPPSSELVIPYKRTKLDGERIALAAARDGVDVVVVNPTVPVGPGDLRPTPTGKMIADIVHGRARAYLARSALNIVAVEDVARAHVRAYERGRSGERYLVGGDNLSIRDVFATVATAACRPAPRLAIPWSAAYLAARVAGLAGRAAALAGRPGGREPSLLILDEVRAGRLPHLFDDSKARAELGHVSRPAVDALAQAARGALAVRCPDQSPSRQRAAERDSS